MRRLLVALTCLASAGCPPPYHVGTKPPEAETVQGDRFSLEAVQSFDDQAAYGRRRVVYVLHEKATGREWIGVSGIGLSELGQHYDGGRKANVADER